MPADMKAKFFWFTQELSVSAYDSPAFKIDPIVLLGLGIADVGIF